MEDQMMFAELVDGVAKQIWNDQKVTIISDTGLFLVTAKSNVSLYPELIFKEIDKEVLTIYKDKE